MRANMNTQVNLIYVQLILSRNKALPMGTSAFTCDLFQCQTNAYVQ